MKKFYDIFRDDNSWNEKTIAGFLAFAVATLYALISLIFASSFSAEVFYGLLTYSAVALGISGAEKIWKK